jgi:hypothetical protein
LKSRRLGPEEDMTLSFIMGMFIAGAILISIIFNTIRVLERIEELEATILELTEEVSSPHQSTLLEIYTPDGYIKDDIYFE